MGVPANIVSRIALGLLAAFVVACGADHETPMHRDGIELETPTTVAGVDLLPLPPNVSAACRRIDEGTDEPILCPTLLPRPSRYMAHAGWTPGPINVSRWDELGVNISYSAESVNPAENRPERFLHFDVQTRTAKAPLPEVLRPAVIGGRRGRLAPHVLLEPPRSGFKASFVVRRATGTTATVPVCRRW